RAVRIGWSLRLTRLMHAGDARPPRYRPRPGAGLRLTDHRIVESSTAIAIEGIVDRARTRSYWLRADERTRDRVEPNLREYFRDEHPVTEAIELPYMCLAYLLQRG